MADINTKEIAEALMHAGISGQKWYQRRYQNPDGTYTELGKIRKRAAYKREDPKNMSTEDLRKATERAELEKRYANATRKESAVQKINKGRAAVAAAIAVPTTIVAGVASGKKLIDYGKQAVSMLKLVKDRAIGKIWLY